MPHAPTTTDSTTRHAAKRRRGSISASSRAAIDKSTSAKDVIQDRNIAFLLKEVRRLKPEMKQDTTVHNITPTYSGSLVSLMNGGITQGTSDSSQRIGDSIRLIDYQGLFHVGNTSTTAAATGRIIVLLDYANDQIAANDILHTVSNSAAPDAMYTFDNYGKKWKLLADKRFSVAANDSGSAAVLSIYHKFKTAYQTRFDAASSTVNKNEIKILFISDQATSTLVVTGNSRIRYNDA